MTTLGISDPPAVKLQSRTRNLILWVVQGALAALFLFAGSMKLMMPVEMMIKQTAFPSLFLRFIGVAETLGALGLILPWALRIRRELTAVAAVGLTGIMVGAVVVTIHTNRWLPALTPLIVGCLLAVVARGRWSSLSSRV